MGVLALAIGAWLIWKEEGRTRAALVQSTEHRIATEELLARSLIESGERLLKDGNPHGLLDILEAFKTAERNPQTRNLASWIWSARNEFHPSRLEHLLCAGGSRRIAAAAFSPDGRWLVTGEENPHQAQLWDVASGLPFGPPLEQTARVVRLAFRPDGSLLATGCFDGTARLWDPSTGQPRGSPLKHGNHAIYGLAFSPDGKLLASLSEIDGTMRLWEADTGKPHGKVMRQESAWDLKFSPDGELLASGSSKNLGAQVWKVST
ncbi:MAG: PD40 domain-containing protein [Planctomycetes bacterium]|nr:PD40 domain-containing protein [Planctomycetota bacterium]